MREETNSKRWSIGAPGIFSTGNLPYFRAVAQTVVEGPFDIFVVRRLGDPVRDFELIARIILRVPNRRLESWAAFRQDREWDDDREVEHYGWVLRHTVWHTDIDFGTEAWKQRGEPAIVSKTRYLSDSFGDVLIRTLQALDHSVKAGIPISDRAETEEWSELSLYRRFDWGVVDMLWHSSVQNQECEAQVFAFIDVVAKLLEDPLAAETSTIESMELSYPPSPYLQSSDKLAL